MTDQRHGGSPPAKTLQVIGIIGASFAGACLILLVPSLFRPDTHVETWILVVLVLLVVLFAAGARHWGQAASPTGRD